MTKRWRPSGPSLVVLAAVAGAPRSSSADQIDVCVAAAERAEPLKKSGRLRASRAALAACVPDACPRAVRDACREMMAAVDEAMPSVVVSVQGPGGGAVEGARLLVDGAPALEAEGGALPIDPGIHVLRAERPDGTAVQASVAIRVGEKRRPVILTFGTRDPPPAPSAPPGPPIGAIVSGGIGLAGLGVFTALGLTVRSEYSHLESTCGATPQGCSSSVIAPVKAKAIGADVGLGVGIVGAGLGVGLWLARPKAAPAARLALVPSSTGLTVTLEDHF